MSKQFTQAQLARIELARRSFPDFIKYTMPSFKWNWHHEVIADALDRAARFEKEYRRVILVTPPRHGKALAVGTPIYTPDRGFVPIEDLEVGDYVYGSDGKPTEVVARTPIWRNRPCYRVCVGNTRDEILADAAHEWRILLPEAGAQVLETRELAVRGGFWPASPSHSIHVCRRVQYHDTVCIQVAAEDHLFLAGRSLVPTHNSELVSRRLPAYFVGKYPQMEGIFASYSEDLGAKMGRDVLRIFESPEFQHVFPLFQFGKKKTFTEVSTTKGGTCKWVGVGGGVTGRGANLVVVDDPIKSREEAESASIRDRIWEWWNDDLMTRLEFPFSVVLTMTRWHPDDLVGRLLKRDKERWKVIHLPLIADYDQFDEPWPDYDPRGPGDPLWPGVRVKGRIVDPNIEIPTEEELIEEIKEDFRAKMAANPYGTNSLDQGRPTAKEGNLFKLDWIQRYTSPPEIMADYCNAQVISIDCNFRKTTSGSAAALVVLGWRQDGNICVLDAKWDRWAWTKLKKEVKKMAKKWPKATFLIEGKANGDALIDELRQEGLRVVDFQPGNESKESRAQLCADVMESGGLYFPENAPWVEPLISLFTSFPTGEFDDPIDATTQAVIRWSARKDPIRQLRRVLGKNQT